MTDYKWEWRARRPAIFSQINQNYRLMKIGKYFNNYKNHAKIVRFIKK